MTRVQVVRKHRKTYAKRMVAGLYHQYRAKGLSPEDAARLANVRARSAMGRALGREERAPSPEEAPRAAPVAEAGP